MLMYIRFPSPFGLNRRLAQARCDLHISCDLGNSLRQDLFLDETDLLGREERVNAKNSNVGDWREGND